MDEGSGVQGPGGRPLPGIWGSRRPRPLAGSLGFDLGQKVTCCLCREDAYLCLQEGGTEVSAGGRAERPSLEGSHVPTLSWAPHQQLEPQMASNWEARSSGSVSSRQTYQPERLFQEAPGRR